MEFGLKNIIYIVIFLVAIAFLTYNLIRYVKYLKLAKNENRFDNIPKRLAKVLGIAFFQKKIFREPGGGFIHIAIFWGFLILLFSASSSVFTGFGINHFWDILGPINYGISFITDIFCALIIIAVIFALIRRYIVKVKRLQMDDKHEKLDALIVLLAILTIVTGLLFENASAIVLNIDAEYSFMPISTLLSTMINPNSAELIHNIAFWVHSLMILAFMNYLPYSKHFHVYSSIPNVYFSTLEPANKLSRIDFTDETIEQYGVSDVTDYTWKTILDSFTCTHCGRCTEVCPANITGKPLDPRDIMVQIRNRTFDKFPIMLKQNSSKNKDGYTFSEKEQSILDKIYVGDYQEPEKLWNCTSCGACMQECPVMNEHVPAIVSMRRSKVMMESDFPEELQGVFANLENNGAPWAFSPMERADWAEGLNVPLASEKMEFDVLYWVGCAGSFDDRAKKVSVAFTKLLQKANVDFAILGTEESCNGDLARRTGNEYLADMLIQQNIEVLKQYKFNKIVVTCPHCFNTFKNEYPEFDAKYEVVHHSKFLNELIQDGKLKVTNNSQINIAYHDSCYLGRYNNIYDEPRKLLKNVPKFNILEPDKTKSKGFCCGAGGGQMFMEENIGTRVNIERTEQLLKTSPDCIALNCPFCLTMIEDGLKAKDVENVKVKDIAELIFENIIN
jgi:Fe-S oxidoreductase/nitrate reductase gamma subunit